MNKSNFLKKFQRLLKEESSVLDMLHPSDMEEELKNIQDRQALSFPPSLDPSQGAENSVFFLLSENILLKEKLTKLQDFIDLDINDFILNCCSDIIDFKTAKQAVELYNIKWFKELLYGDEAKQLIASALIENTVSYTLDINPLWDRISNGDLSDLEEVSLTSFVDNPENLDEEAIEDYSLETESDIIREKRKDIDIQNNTIKEMDSPSEDIPLDLLLGGLPQ